MGRGKRERYWKGREGTRGNGGGEGIVFPYLFSPKALDETRTNVL